jgi:integrase
VKEMAKVRVKTLADGTKRYSCKVSIDGKYVYTHTWPTQRDAKREADAIRKRHLLGDPLKPKPTCFDAFVATWLGTLSVKASTRKDYEYTCGHLLRYFGKTPIGQIGPQDIETFVARMSEEYSANSVHKAKTRLQQILLRAEAYGVIRRSPMHLTKRNLTSPQRERDIVFLEADRIVDFIGAAPEFYRPMFIVWFATGMRIAEIAALTWDGVSWANDSVRVKQQLKEQQIEPYAKSNAGLRTIGLDPGVMDVLREHREGCPPSEFNLVFPTVTGRPIHMSNFGSRVLRPITKELGIEGFTAHSIRHTFATVLLSDGINPKKVAQMMGHSDKSGDLLWRTYAHVLKADHDRASAAIGKYVVREGDGLADGIVITFPTRQMRSAS